jgi:hypothetical protein
MTGILGAGLMGQGNIKELAWRLANSLPPRSLLLSIALAGFFVLVQGVKLYSHTVFLAEPIDTDQERETASRLICHG